MGIIRETVKSAFTLGVVGAIFAGGYVVGNRAEPKSDLDALTNTPVAQGYMNVPNDYDPAVRLHDGERAPVFVHSSGIEVPMIEELPRLVTAYERDATKMESAMAEISKGSYSLVR